MNSEKYLLVVLNHLFRVRPDEITEGSLVRYLLVPLYQSDLVQGPDVGRQSPVNTEYLTIYESSHSQHVKHFAAVSPDIAVTILVLTLVIESINLDKQKIISFLYKII